MKSQAATQAHPTYRSTLSRLLLSAMLTVAFLGPVDAQAWGRRGHAAIAETAAMVAAGRDKKQEFLRDRAFDLGYYANVPDLLWKSPETYQAEWTNHFMDLEIFTRAFKRKAEEPTAQFELDRASFETKFPEIPRTAGRAYWRVQELMARLREIQTELNKTDLSKERRHERQAAWLVIAGVIGHYVGDLGQPLHVTENYNGQLTDQKGIHAYFEDDVVDDYPPGELEHEIGKEASRKAKAFFKGAAKKSELSLLQELAAESNRELHALLKIDTRLGRKNTSQARAAYRKMQIERMAVASLYLAELWSRATGWPYDGEKFFNFVAKPEFIAPPGTTDKP